MGNAPIVLSVMTVAFTKQESPNLVVFFCSRNFPAEKIVRKETSWHSGAEFAIMMLVNRKRLVGRVGGLSAFAPVQEMKGNYDIVMQAVSQDRSLLVHAPPRSHDNSAAHVG